MLKFVEKDQSPPGIGDGRGWYYLQKETGQVFRGLSWHAFLQSIHAHRLGMMSSKGMDLESGWIDRLEHEMCEEGKNGRDCLDSNAPSVYVSELVRTGRKLWGELHAYALAYPVNPAASDIEKAKEWMSRWESRVPSFSCNCRGHYESITRHRPTDFSGRKAFWMWSSELHNVINGRLQKEQWSPSVEVLMQLG